MDANTVYPHPIYRLYLVFIHEVGNSKQAMHTLQNLKQLLQLDHELPVRFLQIVAEVFLARVDRFAADPGNQKVFVIKVTSVKFGRLARRRHNFDTHFLALSGHLQRFVIDMDIRHDSDVHKLRWGSAPIREYLNQFDLNELNYFFFFFFCL